MNRKSQNIVYLFPDQMGASWLPIYGNKDVIAPEITKISENSVVFSNAFSSCPLCTPYRGTVFTGRYPMQTGIVSNNYRIPKCELKLPELLNEAGYLTSYIGKWHLSGLGKEPVGGMIGPGHGQRWIPHNYRAGFQRFKGWESGHVDHWKGVVWEDDPDRPIQLNGHETDGLTELIVKEIDELANQDKPFALFLAYQAPHPPCSAPEKMLKLYHEKDNLHNRPNIPVDKNLIYDVPLWKHSPEVREFVENYFGEITNLDESIGRVYT